MREGQGTVLYLFNGGHVDLRNTSRERTVPINFETGSGLVRKNGVFCELTKDESETEEGKDLLATGRAFIHTVEQSEPDGNRIAMVKEEFKVEVPKVENPVEKNWDDMSWHEKKKFADDNNYEGKNYKEDTLDNWFKGFVKDNEV